VVSIMKHSTLPLYRTFMLAFMVPKGILMLYGRSRGTRILLKKGQNYFFFEELFSFFLAISFLPVFFYAATTAKL
jgi:hypothetical protein